VLDTTLVLLEGEETGCVMSTMTRGQVNVLAFLKMTRLVKIFAKTVRFAVKMPAANMSLTKKIVL